MHIFAQNVQTTRTTYVIMDMHSWITDTTKNIMTMKHLFTVVLLTACGLTAAAETPFFNTEPAEKLITFGARIGLNTSNYTTNGKYLYDYNVNSWGLGFDGGVVCNINFRDYISIQPGIFYQSRSSDYAYCSVINATSEHYYTQLGHTRSYNISVPVMASVHFNLSDDIRWNVEIGPYFNFYLSGKRFQRARVSSTEFYGTDYDVDMDPNTFDAGIKVGTSLTLFSHYEIGAHYMAGLTDYWTNKKVADGYLDYSGKSKAWVFTVGYNF